MGMIFAFILSLVTVCVGGFLIYRDKDSEGIALILSELAILAAIFVYGRHTQKKELEASRDSFQ